MAAIRAGVQIERVDMIYQPDSSPVNLRIGSSYQVYRATL
jgi:hypothetical protein